MSVPIPPSPFDPLVEEWNPGVPLVRVHPARLSSRTFNDTLVSGRFRPVFDQNDAIVPTMYSAADSDAALSESVFHSVSPLPSRRRIAYSRLLERVISTIEPTRTLRLAQFHGFGLGRLATTRRDLIDTGRRSYPATARWSQAVHDHADELDGIVWMSRQFDSSKALILFGDRVVDGDLIDRPAEIMIPLSIGPGYDLVADAANRAQIVIVRR